MFQKVIGVAVGVGVGVGEALELVLEQALAVWQLEGADVRPIATGRIGVAGSIKGARKPVAALVSGQRTGQTIARLCLWRAVEQGDGPCGPPLFCKPAGSSFGSSGEATVPVWSVNAVKPMLPSVFAD